MITKKISGPGYMHAAATAAEIVAELPALMQIEEVAKALRCSIRQVHRWIALGKLQTVGLNSRPVRIPRKAVERLLEQAMSRPRG